MNDIVASLIFGGGGGGGSKGYPQYIATEKNAVKARINALLENIENPLVIGFNTDQHLPKNPSQGTNTTTEQIVYGLRSLRDLTKEINFDLVVLGGDSHGGTTGTIEMMQESATYLVSEMKGTECPYIMLVGNHEGGQDNQSITRAQVYASHVTPSLINNEIIPIDGINSYMDDSTNGIRYIFLDAYGRSQVGYTYTQYDALLTSMLSGMPSGYKAIIFSHHPLDENLPQNQERTLWNNAAKCHDVLQTYKDDILFCVDGHVHNNLNTDLDGVTFIATTCSGHYELNDGSTRPTNSADGTAYDVFVVDTDNKVVHAVRFGNGNDREISYAHTSPVEPRGNILEDVEWADGKRLGSGGALTDASGYSTTDFITDIHAGDVLYFAEGTLPMAKSAWTLYKDDGTAGGVKNAVTEEDYGATYGADKMYVALYLADGTCSSSKTWKSVNDAKNGLASDVRFFYGELEVYSSGYIKSVKLAYDGEHLQTFTKIKITLPTAIKATADIRVNEPFEEEE